MPGTDQDVSDGTGPAPDPSAPGRERSAHAGVDRGRRGMRAAGLDARCHGAATR